MTGFEQFWSSYPKKKSKGQAEKAWTKLKPSEQLQEQILTALEQAKTSEQWTKDGEEFVPHPATWINAKGWLDEHTSPAALPQAKCAWANGEPCQDYSIPPSKYCADHKAKIVKVQQAHGVIPLEAKA
ncbi:MAG: hypothetical protein KGJ82_11240 [Nitrospirota bacterium]|nr:hypothetical protein [Nitrospirota bacterium]